MSGKTQSVWRLKESQTSRAEKGKKKKKRVDSADEVFTARKDR